jgi:siroheme synthase-like protein
LGTEHTSVGRELSLPVNVLLKGRLCLLVGAGKVAQRKALNLLGHGARIVLVAPRTTPDLERLADGDRVTWRRESYAPSLLDEERPLLVYTATDDDAVNRGVAADCADRRILCCSASSWQEGDFISPSIVRWGRGQVSITTEGSSCRQARFMRLRLEKLLGGERRLLLVGVDLRRAPVDDFERIRPDGVAADRLRDRLAHLAGLEEFALLVTCNRVELYAWASGDETLAELVRSVLGLDAIADHVYAAEGDAVLEHAANVVAGHLSEMTCETPIVSQWKEAFRTAFERHEAGVFLQKLHDRVPVVAKKIRAFHRDAREGLPDLVARLIAGRRARVGGRVLVLGAGDMGREVATRLLRDPSLTVSWANRTVERIPADAACERLPLATALSETARFDQVVAVLGAAEPVVRPSHLLNRDGRPAVLVDLGMPRNVDPEVAQVEGVEVADLGHFRDGGGDREALFDLTHAVLASGAGDAPRG